MKKTKLKVYEAPQAEVIGVETQGILCASAGGGETTGFGVGTTNMNMHSYGW